MAWTTQTFSVGQVLTAAQMNNLNNNITALANGDTGAPLIQPVAIKNTVAGPFTVINSTTNEVISSGSFVKLKEIKIPLSGGLRVLFTLSAPSTGDVRATIYVNGISVGTERSATAGATTVFTEDISSLLVGDLVQVYARVASGGNGAVSDMTLQESTPVLSYSVVL